MGEVAGTTPRPATGARLVVRLLGAAEVWLDGRPLPDLTAPRMQLLLARLALEPAGAVSRKQLAWDLWPDSNEAQARTNLRKLLHELRRALPDLHAFLDLGAQALRWHPGAPVWIDVVAFGSALDAGDEGAAVDLYRGDLLPGCYDDAVLTAREDLRARAVLALSHLMARAEREGRDDEVIERSRRLLRIDPLHEPAYRALMGALDRRGERSEALRTYHRCLETLSQELGVVPEPGTTEIYERLRRPARVPLPDILSGPLPGAVVAGRRGTGVAPGRDGGAEHVHALVGREAECAAVSACWRETLTGRPRFLLVTGEAGIGKTRIIDELCRRVAGDGHPVARTRAYEMAGGGPWDPVAGWLRSETVEPGLRRLPPAALAELAHLLPELRGGDPDRADPRLGSHRRPHLLEAVRLALVGEGRPQLLVIDDLQWCDAETLALGRALVLGSPGVPVLVAATLRDDEIDDDHPAARLRDELAASGQLTQVSLAGLDPDGTAELATQVGGRTVDGATALELWKQTGGNALFVIEAVRAGFGQGVPSARAAFTPTVHAVITARLARLSPEARALVDVAATIGRPFAPDLLGEACGMSGDDFGDALDEAWHRRIVQLRGLEYDFTHDTIREVALALISPARRRKLHRAVADALERRHAPDLAEISGRLAFHYEQAGLLPRAVEAYERAADHAARVFALDDGIAVLVRGLRVLDQLSRSTARDERELRMRVALGIALVARLGYGAPAVQRTFERALRLTRHLGREAGPPVLRGLALHAVVACQFDRAAEMGRQLLAAGRLDRTAHVEGEYVLGVTAFWLGDFAAAHHHLTNAVASYRAEDAALHIARYGQDPNAVCLARLALAELFLGRPREADRAMRNAQRYAATLEHPMTTGYVCAYDAVLAALVPEHHDLDRAVTALQGIASRMRIGYFETLSRMLAGWRDVSRGDLDGREAIRAVTDLWHREQQLHLTMGLSLLARAHLQAGALDEARTAIADARRWTDQTRQRYLLAELLRLDAELASLDGEAGTARGLGRQALEVATSQGSPWLAQRAEDTLDRVRADALAPPRAAAVPPGTGTVPERGAGHAPQGDPAEWSGGDHDDRRRASRASPGPGDRAGRSGL